MDDLGPHLKRLAIFAAVARAGSMSAAARTLGLSTSAVSQQLRLLEQQHGVTLLHRSTRKLALTEVGARLAEHSQAMVDAATLAREQLRLAHDAPSGELRLAAPVGFARHVALALSPLLAEHPALKLRLLVDDERIDLIDARIDLAFRGGRLVDSSWTAKRLCLFDWALCASPEYLRRHGEPQTPAELAHHQWLAAGRDGPVLKLALQRAEGEAQSLAVEPRIVSNNQFSLEQMCAAGLGLAMLVRPNIDDELRKGRLVSVLPDWRMDPIPIWAVTPQREQPAKVRHAMAAMAAYLVKLPGVQVG
jgi:DNA-binding transcriptional LysR family regulator